MTNELKGEEEKEKNNITRWNYGINAGVYFANKYPASFYNGSENNDNSLKYIWDNPYWYQEIKQKMGATDTIVITGYPGNMHYNVVMSGGVFIRYNLNKNYGFCLDVNYTKLKAEDAITVQVDPMSYLTFPDIRAIPVQGIEQRVHMDLLLQRNFWLKTKIYFFLQGGMNFNFTRVMKSAVFFNGQEYNMVNIYGSNNYVPNTSLQENPVTQGGVGYGFALGGGAGFPLVTQLGIEPGGFINYNKVALPGYPDFKLSYGFYVRFLFGNILPKPEPE